MLSNPEEPGHLTANHPAEGDFCPKWPEICVFHRFTRILHHHWLYIVIHNDSIILEKRRENDGLTLLGVALLYNYDGWSSGRFCPRFGQFCPRFGHYWPGLSIFVQIWPRVVIWASLLPLVHRALSRWGQEIPFVSYPMPKSLGNSWLTGQEFNCCSPSGCPARQRRDPPHI